MRLVKLAAVSALALGLATSAFAQSEADKNASPEGPGTQDPLVLGWDINQAGTTDEARMAFFGQMAPDQQASARERCLPALQEATKNATPQGPDTQDPMALQLAFCKAITQ